MTSAIPAALRQQSSLCNRYRRFSVSVITTCINKQHPLLTASRTALEHLKLAPTPDLQSRLEPNSAPPPQSLAFPPLTTHTYARPSGPASPVSARAPRSDLIMPRRQEKTVLLCWADACADTGALCLRGLKKYPPLVVSLMHDPNLVIPSVQHELPVSRLDIAGPHRSV